MYKQTEEHKQKIKIANLGRKVSLEGRTRMSLAKKKSGLVPPSNLGKKFSEEHRNRISNSLIGKKNWLKGGHHTAESKRKLSISLRGSKSPLWKGGKTKLQIIIRGSFQYRLWRSDVFTRDNFTCQECFLSGIYLEAHHKNPFSKIIEQYNIKTLEEALSCSELWDINNGITLCLKCHNKTKQNKVAIWKS